MTQSNRTLLLATAVLIFIAGCGKKKVEGPSGTVSGKILYKGNPVPEGCVVVFTPQMGALPATGKIGADGSYKLQFKGAPDIPVDNYKVSITPPAFEETPQQAMERIQRKEKQKEYPEVPQKYRRADTSGKKFSVKEGENTYNLDMKD
jgi:hypothetical protein